jgi:hypothetical protein
MLHSHPRMAVPPETRFVIDTYDRRQEFGDLTDPANRRALAEWITGRPQTKFHDLGLDAADVNEQIVAGPPTLGSALAIVFQAYAARFGKPRWGDKRPTYIQHLDHIMRLFPDAQVVHVIRDGRDCVASLKEMTWYKRDINHAIATWAQAVDAGQRAAKMLGPSSYHEMRYEDLVAEPETVLRDLCGFLGEEYDPAMTEPSRVAATAVPAQKHWHERTHGAVTTGRIRSWQRRLEPAEIALAESALASRMKQYGYELSDPGRPSAAQLAQYAKVVAERHRTARMRALRDRWDRRHEPNPVAAQPLPNVPPARSSADDLRFSGRTT